MCSERLSASVPHAFAPSTPIKFPRSDRCSSVQFFNSAYGKRRCPLISCRRLALGVSRERIMSDGPFRIAIGGERWQNGMHVKGVCHSTCLSQSYAPDIGDVVSTQ